MGSHCYQARTRLASSKQDAEKKQQKKSRDSSPLLYELYRVRSRDLNSYQALPHPIPLLSLITS